MEKKGQNIEKIVNGLNLLVNIIIIKNLDPKVDNHKSIQYGSCYTAYLILK